MQQVSLLHFNFFFQEGAFKYPIPHVRVDKTLFLLPIQYQYFSFEYQPTQYQSDISVK